MTALVILSILAVVSLFWVRSMYPQDPWSTVIPLTFGFWVMAMFALFILCGYFAIPIHKIFYLV